MLRKEDKTKKQTLWICTVLLYSSGIYNGREGKWKKKGFKQQNQFWCFILQQYPGSEGDNAELPGHCLRKSPNSLKGELSVTVCQLEITRRAELSRQPTFMWSFLSILSKTGGMEKKTQKEKWREEKGSHNGLLFISARLFKRYSLSRDILVKLIYRCKYRISRLCSLMFKNVKSKHLYISLPLDQNDLTETKW